MAVTDGPLGGNSASLRATAEALAKVDDARAVVLVEGISDQLALETAAAGLGRNLDAERVVVVPMGGAHAIGRYLAMFAPMRDRLRLAGLCDLKEEKVFRRALEAADVGSAGTRAGMERLGFHVCVNDLEEELIRAVGPGEVEALIHAHGDSRSFRSFQTQLAWRGQAREAQLWRYLRSSAQRNLRYARVLAEAAVGRDALPRPLAAVLTAV